MRTILLPLGLAALLATALALSFFTAPLLNKALALTLPALAVAWLIAVAVTLARSTRLSR